MRILGIDYGDARTGLAVCDRTEFLASPVGTIEEKSFAKKTYNAKIQYIADHLKNFGALSLSAVTPAAKTYAPTKMQSSLKQKPQHNVSKSLQLFFAAVGILLVFISIIFLILSHHRKNLLKEHR